VRVGGWRWGSWPIAIALVAGDYFGVVPFSSTPFFLVLAWLSLRLRGLGWRDVGFTRPAGWPRALALGTLAGIAMELFSTFVSVPLLSRLTGQPPGLSDFRPLVGNLKLVLAFLVPMWLLAAFGEELVYRGYLMNRLAGLGRSTRAAWLLSAVVVSVLFGWGHGGQGLTGMLQEGFAGLLVALVYLACGRDVYPGV
jgi:membrane protease YdiL (CAAX protease family)